jgi:hypothetical protein
MKRRHRPDKRAVPTAIELLLLAACLGFLFAGVNSGPLPELAGQPDNIEFVPTLEHLLATVAIGETRHSAR